MKNVVGKNKGIEQDKKKSTYEPARVGGIPLFRRGEEKSKEERAAHQILEDISMNIGDFVDDKSIDLGRMKHIFGLLTIQLEM